MDAVLLDDCNQDRLVMVEEEPLNKFKPENNIFSSGTALITRPQTIYVI